MIKEALEVYGAASLIASTLVGAACYRLGHKHGYHKTAKPIDYHEMLEEPNRYVIKRKLGNHEWNLYSGPSGDLALRWWEQVRLTQEKGTAIFMDGGVIRDRYDGGK